MYSIMLEVVCVGFGCFLFTLCVGLEWCWFVSVDGVLVGVCSYLFGLLFVLLLLVLWVFIMFDCVAFF